MTSSGKRPCRPAAPPPRHPAACRPAALPPAHPPRAPALRALRWGAGEGETAQPASWAHKLTREAGQPAALVLSLVRESAEPGWSKKNVASLALVRSSRPAWSRGGAGRRSPYKLAPRASLPLSCSCDPRDLNPFQGGSSNPVLREEEFLPKLGAAEGFSHRAECRSQGG